MRRLAIVGGTIVILLSLVVTVVVRRELMRGPAPLSRDASVIAAKDGAIAGESDRGFIFGRVTTHEGAVLEGRLRWGEREEAFWNETFNGWRNENPWRAHVPAEDLVEERPLEVFGLRLGTRTHEVDTERPFMARFGDIRRIDVRGRRIIVTLKSGTAHTLDRYGADDIADGLRVWDLQRGVVEIDERGIRSVEFLRTPALGEPPRRLQGTVHTGQGSFTGFIQWDRMSGVGSDRLIGRTTEAEIGLRFDEIRSIVKEREGTLAVTLRDGTELALSGAAAERGLFVSDPRFGRVLVSWEDLESIDLAGGVSGPAYDDFPPGLPLTGHVRTRAGERLAGRIVFDLDESETTETLDAPRGGVNYSLFFGLITSIKPEEHHSLVTLHSGEELELESAGDLGPENAGVLVFVDGGRQAEYVRWKDVAAITLDPPTAMYPRLQDEAR